MNGVGDNAVVADLATARDAAAGEKTGRKPRTKLPSPAPPVGADREQIAGWLSAVLGLGADPVKSAERYGRHEDARMVVILASGHRVTFERTADAADARKLARIVMVATGAQVPPYSHDDGQWIFGSLLRLADLLADDDARSEAQEWGRTFLHGAERNTITVSDLGTPGGKWEAVSILTTWRPPADLPPYTPAAERSVIVADAQTRLVRVSDFAAHVRGSVRISWTALHARMVEVGWSSPGELEQRQPKGTGKQKVHIYSVNRDWDAS